MKQTSVKQIGTNNHTVEAPLNQLLLLLLVVFLSALQTDERIVLQI
jgi:hypothetical protein